MAARCSLGPAAITGTVTAGPVAPAVASDTGTYYTIGEPAGNQPGRHLVIVPETHRDRWAVRVTAGRHRHADVAGPAPADVDVPGPGPGRPSSPGAR